MTEQLTRLSLAYIEAVDHYNSEEARRIELELRPLLLESGATNRASAIVVDHNAYWTGRYGVEYEYVFGGPPQTV